MSGSYPEELTNDQVTYLQERADETRQRWRENTSADLNLLYERRVINQKKRIASRERIRLAKERKRNEQNGQVK